MSEMKIERDARVIASDGDAGRVTQVVVDPQTREVTDMVVDDHGHQWLVSIEEVVSVEAGAVRLRGTREQLRAAQAFDPEQFHVLAAERADAETHGRATHGGAPLRDAQDNAVEIGEVKQSAIGDQQPAAARSNDRKLELREEELLVRKRSVETGTVGVHTDVVSELRTLEVPVTREEVTIERHAVDRRPSDRPVGQNETINVPVHEEQVSVDKQAVVYEEVEVGRRTLQETQHVSETVRREKAVVNKEGDVDLDDQPEPPRRPGR